MVGFEGMSQGLEIYNTNANTSQVMMAQNPFESGSTGFINAQVNKCLDFMTILIKPGPYVTLESVHSEDFLGPSELSENTAGFCL